MMEKNKVLQQLADRIKAHFAIPENREAFIKATAPMRNFCKGFAGEDIKRAIDRINLRSGINNLN